MRYFSIHKKSFFIAIAILMVQFAYAQKDVLPLTVIFKVKEQYRTICSKDGIKHAQLNKILIELGLDRVTKIFPNKQKEDIDGNVDLSLIYQLTYTNSFSEEEAIYKLKKLKIFEYVEPYIIPKLTYTPNDTDIVDQYYLNLINAFNAWGVNKGDTNIVIGITDTGWEPTHPDLLANVKINYADPVDGFDNDGDGYIDNYVGWDLGMNDNNALFESNSHGVNVTGLAAAVTDNVTGIAGVGFDTKFLPVKISNATGVLTHAYQGVVYAADHGCFIINCSWGSYYSGQFQRDIIDYAIINKGCLVVAAVGNDNGENIFYPAGYDGVFSVAATEQSDLKKNNSNYGYYVDISAPGEAMWTTGANGGFSINGGTSMAAPLVSGGAALIKTQYPSYTNQQVAALLKTTADDLNALNPTYINKLGKGRLDLFDALMAVSPQYVELTKTKVTDNNNSIFIVGDTISVTGLFTNYLATLNGLTVTLNTSSSYINIVDGTTNLPNLTTLDTASNFNDYFLLEVLSGAALNEVVTIQATISNGTYTNIEYFTITLNQDYINLEENQISTTITSRGKIGFNDLNNSIGLGFTYQGEQLLYEAGLMIGDGASRVADAVRGVTVQDQDFSSAMNVLYNPPYISALDIEGIMNDSPLSSPLDIIIKHYAYAFPNAPDDKYVIVIYDIENNSSLTLNNLYAGIFADWDIDNPNLNKAGFDAINKMGFVYSLSPDSLYAAIKLLSNNTAVNYSLDMDGSGVVDPNGGGFTTAEKYTTLSTYRNYAGSFNGLDVAHVVSAGSFSLAPGQHEVLAFALIAGDSLLDIQNSAIAAQNQYDNNPLSINDIEQKDIVSLYPNPTKGKIHIETKERITRVVVKNLLGETIINSSSKDIYLSNCANGFYLIEVLTENVQFKQKVLLIK
jgi:hypothetical protein